jgi:hypothetical protein
VKEVGQDLKERNLESSAAAAAALLACMGDCQCEFVGHAQTCPHKCSMSQNRQDAAAPI